MLPCRIDAQAQLFERPAHLHGAAIPEQLFDLPQNDRHGIGGKTDAPRLVKAVVGLDQPHAPRAVEVIVLDAPAPEPPGAGMHQPQILLNECTPPGLVRYHCNALFSFIM